VANFLSNELAEFHRFVSEKLAKGETDLSPEAAVDQWREMHANADEVPEDAAAVEESLADMAAGDRGMLLDEFDQRFRGTHGLPPRS
jgi:hypothetical protein